VILMAHEPDIFPQVTKRVSLTLSGHTHGGQVDVFGWRPVAASLGSRRYPAGHFREYGRDLIVSRGLGCTGLPIRFGAWPEILEIDLS
jgi:predicted MPP superfamily phosphohydrolase